jgi:amino-acid N-acetyltransferase
VIRHLLRRLRRADRPASQPKGVDTSLLYELPLSAVQFVYRKAQPGDQEAIRALVRSERLNPNGLDWQRFAVATLDDQIVAAVQLRQHADGSCELGSFVVAKPIRRLGVGGRLVSTLLLNQAGAVYLITRQSMVDYFKRWGFAAVSFSETPADVRRNYLIGSLISFMSRLIDRQAQRLRVLKRPPAYQGVVVRFTAKAASSSA